MARPASILDTGLVAALNLAAETPWRDLTLTAIAEEAGLTLQDFHGVATKDDLGRAVSVYFDRAMSAEKVSMDESPRERLFDVIMLRFEAMEDHREGLKSLTKHIESTPSLLLGVPGALNKTAGWALVSAGLDNNHGAALGLKRVAVAAVIAQAYRAWRRETSPDFALTMAALDKGLRDAQSRMEQLARFTGKRHAADTEEHDTPDASPEMDVGETPND